jgi:SAM-dependent methyltransferase
VTTTGPYEQFPAGFFSRADEADDRSFYAPVRLVTHIDDGAIAAVGALYEELGLRGAVLDLMSSWVSHFRAAPEVLVALGMNGYELARNEQATGAVVHDLNRSPSMPFRTGAFDAAVCCVSVDYLVQPIEVFRAVHRVLRPGAPFVCTFSNRCFPTKAIRGWLLTDDDAHRALVAEYFRRAGGWDDVRSEVRRAPGPGRDPLYAVWARRTEDDHDHAA